jgi:hypothetical protein
MDRLTDRVSEKIHKLSAEQLAAVDSFLDSLQPGESRAASVRAMMRVSEPAFAVVWSNPDDAEYDDL